MKKTLRRIVKSKLFIVCFGEESSKYLASDLSNKNQVYENYYAEWN